MVLRSFGCSNSKLTFFTVHHPPPPYVQWSPHVPVIRGHDLVVIIFFRFEKLDSNDHFPDSTIRGNSLVIIISPPSEAMTLALIFGPPKVQKTNAPKMAIFGHKKRNFQKKTVVTADKEGLSMGGLVLIFLLEVPRWSLDVGWVGGVNFSGSLARSFLKQRASSLP